jgi:hypothetical protein
MAFEELAVLGGILQPVHLIYEKIYEPGTVVHACHPSYTGG